MAIDQLPMESTDQDQELAKLKESLKIKVEDIGTLRKKLIITVPQSAIEDKRSGQYTELKRESVIPGFRRGHAPMELIQKRFGSDVNHQLSSQLLSSSYLAAVEKQEIKTIGDPQIWTAALTGGKEPDKLVSVEEAFELVKLPKSGDFTFACEVEIRPEFELPSLDKVKINEPTVEIGTEQVEESIQRLRTMRGQYQVSDQPMKTDDIFTCSLKMTCGDTVLLEEPDAQLACRAMNYAGIPLQKLAEVMPGSKVGDSRSFDTQAPEDHKEANVRNQPVKVELRIKEIKQLILPEIDDEFLKQMGCQSKSELESWVKANLESYRAEEARQTKRQQAYDYLLQNTQVQLPDGLSQRQTERVVARRMLDLARRGVPETEIVKHVDEITTSAKEDAVKDLKLQFIMEKIAEQWEVDVTEEEVNGQIAAIAQRQNRRFDRVRDDLIRTKNITSLYLHVRDEKIVDQIIEKADIQPTTSKKD